MRQKVKEMPKCPFCKREIKYLHSYYQEVVRYRISLNGKGNIQRVRDSIVDSKRIRIAVCPMCGKNIPIYADIEKFLKEEYIILHPNEPEIKWKGKYALFRGRVYKIEWCVSDHDLLHLNLIKDELVADILKAELE